MVDIVELLILMLERSLNEYRIELTLDDMDKLRDLLDEILTDKEL